jgi:hypothetical protein
MRQTPLVAMLALGALGLAACNDTAGPDGALELDTPDQTTQSLTQADRDEILEILDESGLFAEDFGNNDLSGSSVAASVAAAPAEEVNPTPAWARLRGRPVNLEEGGVTIEVDEETGLAIATKALDFDGEFVMDNTKDGMFNPTSKPLQETLLQQAAFEKLDEEVTDDKGRPRHWKLVKVSPARFVMTDEEKRTVRITRVTIEVNDAVVLDLNDPEPLMDIETDLLGLADGDKLAVTAYVENDNIDNTPPTFVYFYIFHSKPPRGTWHRVLMVETLLEDGSSAFTLSDPWMVEGAPAHGKLMIDALDSQTFLTESEDDYRANVWGILHHARDDGPTT